MKKDNPTSNVKMPTLTEGIVDNKPLFTGYYIHKNSPQMPDILKPHIFKSDWYWLAGRYVDSYPDASYFSVRIVASEIVGGGNLCTGGSDGFGRHEYYGSVRPVVCIQSGVQLTEYIEDGYNWKVDQT